MRARCMLALVVALAGHQAASSTPTWAGDPRAEQLDAARALATAGLALYESRQYADALERFRGAERIHQAPPHQLYIARCLRELGRVVEARDAYRTLSHLVLAADAPSVFTGSQQEARAELVSVEARVAQLAVSIAGPLAGLQVQVDERAVSPAARITLDVDPGEHRVTLSRADLEPQTRTITLQAGGAATVEFAVAAVEPGPGTTPADGPPVGPIVLMGLGGAGVLVGGIMGGLALGKRNALDDACPDPAACPRENESLEDDGRTFGHASTGAFVAGGALAAGGLIWLLLSLSSDEDAPSDTATRVFPTRDGIGLRF
jgi:hypothetical protein